MGRRRRTTVVVAALAFAFAVESAAADFEVDVVPAGAPGEFVITATNLDPTTVLAADEGATDVRLATNLGDVATLTAAATTFGCTLPLVDVAECPVAPGGDVVVRMEIRGSAGDETLGSTVTNGAFPVFIDPGEGNDAVNGSLAGTEIVDYASRIDPVTVTITDGGSVGNGAAGEDDSINASVDGIRGGLGDDTLTSTRTTPVRVFGGFGADTITTGSGDDTIVPGPGDDTIDGGAGGNTVDYSAAAGQVELNTETGAVNDGDGGTDVYVQPMWRVIGTAFGDVMGTGPSGGTVEGRGGADTLTGDSANAILDGGDGNDILRPRGATNIVYGGDGNDTLDYSAAGGPVVADGNTGSDPGLNGFGGTDFYPLADIEGISGGPFADTLTARSAGSLLEGLDGDDVLTGRGGDDDLRGGAGTDLLVPQAGNDAVRGGTGTDTVRYASAAGPVTVDLATGTAVGQDGLLGTDTFPDADIENAEGGPLGDTITTLATGGTVDGAGGADTLTGRDGPDVLIGGGGGDLLAGGSGDDTLVGGDGNDMLAGGDGQDELLGGDGDDVLSGGSGDDVHDGGAGDDTVTYAGRAASVTATLSDSGPTTGNGEAGENDTILVGVEGLTGGTAGDTLTTQRTSGPSRIEAGEGDDTILARNGVADIIDCGPGSDTGERDADETSIIGCESLAAPASAPAPAPDPPPAPAPAPESDPAPAPPPGGPTSLPPPQRGESVNLTQVSGTITITPPGSTKPVTITSDTAIETGTIVDATKGRVTVVSDVSTDGTESMRFFAGVFRVTQATRGAPIVTADLVGGDLSGCPTTSAGYKDWVRDQERYFGRKRAKPPAKRRSAPGATAATAKKRTTRKKTAKKKGGRSRKLWGSGKAGRFRTTGREASATVRGTRWLTEDFCRSSKVTVREGVVEVRDRRTGATIVLRRNQSVTTPFTKATLRRIARGPSSRGKLTAKARRLLRR